MAPELVSVKSDVPAGQLETAVPAGGNEGRMGKEPGMGKLPVAIVSGSRLSGTALR
jgi:hypothetical protein